MHRSLVVVGVAFATWIVPVASVPGSATPGSSERVQAGPVEPVEPVVLEPSIVAQVPSDPQAFVQGLVAVDDTMYMTSGLYGQSWLAEVDPSTGRQLRRLELPDAVFAEGLAKVDDRLIVLTWNEHVAYVVDVASFTVVDEFTYEGEGWGLCFDGTSLVMSDGSATLTERDPQTFAVTGTMQVTLGGNPVERLNELECDAEVVWANVWTEPTVMRIDRTSGAVTGVADLSTVIDVDTPVADNPDAVLNGIAAATEDDLDHGHLYLAGKLWPTMYEVQLIDQP